MKIVIIGSKGFIGSHALQYFLSKTGYECWGCDVLVDYVDEHYFLIDSTNSDFNEVFESSDFDVCINCSGAANVYDSLIHPLRDFTLNTFNVIKLLEAIRKHNPSCKFVNISSAAVYGNPSVLPVNEKADLQPVSPYGYHKLQAENICEEFHRFYKLQTCSVRIFSAYGNGLKKQLFWDVAQKLLNNDKVVLFGTGNESRDFIHINDIAKAIELVITKGLFNAAYYNVANGEEITTRDAAEKLQSLLGYHNRLTFNGEVRKGDPLNWRGDVTALKALGYSKSVSIDEGLNYYVQWLREEKLG